MWSRPRFYARNWAANWTPMRAPRFSPPWRGWGDEAYRGVLITPLEQKSSPKMKVQALQDLVYVLGPVAGGTPVSCLDDYRPAMVGGYSAAPRLLRVCDVAVDHINRLLGSVFPFAGSGGSIRMRSFGRRRRH